MDGDADGNHGHGGLPSALRDHHCAPTGPDCGHRPIVQAAVTETVIGVDALWRRPSDDGLRNSGPKVRSAPQDQARGVRAGGRPGVMVRTSVQPDAVRCWSTTFRPETRLLDSCPVPALPSVAVKVTVDPDTTDVRVAVIDSLLGTSRQVLYGVLLFATSYTCWRVATSQRANSWAS